MLRQGIKFKSSMLFFAGKISFVTHHSYLSKKGTKGTKL